MEEPSLFSCAIHTLERPVLRMPEQRAVAKPETERGERSKWRKNRRWHDDESDSNHKGGNAATNKRVCRACYATHNERDVSLLTGGVSMHQHS